MKIQILASSAIVALLTATSATAGDLIVENDATNSVAISGAGYFANSGSAGPYWGDSYSNKGRALAGTVLVKGCDCDDKDVTLENYSLGALAVGKAVAGSTVLK